MARPAAGGSEALLSTPSFTETPAFLEADGETVLGVLTAPAGEPNGRAAVFVPAGGGLPWVNRDVFPVAACRSLAADGYHAVRFDYRASGESTGTVDRYSIDRLFTAEVHAAVGWARTWGLDRLVLVGFCYGARTALAAAQEIDGLEALVLISEPVYHNPGTRYADRWAGREYVRRALTVRALRGLLRAEDRRRYLRLVRAKVRAVAGRGSARGGERSDLFVHGLGRLVDRGVRVLLVYGEEDEEYRDFRRSWPRIRPLLERAGPLIQVRILPGRVHSFDEIATQDAVTELVSSFLARQPHAPLARTAD